MTGARILVIHESEAFLETACAVLEEAGFQPLLARSAAEARPALESGVDAVVLDVAVPDALPFVWVPALRRDPATRALPVLLVASVYDRTAYKRRPVDLHGADDYIEQHHVPDSLAAKMGALLAGRGRREVSHAGVVPEADRARRAALREAALAREQRARDGGDPITAIVRLVASDLALYEGTSPSPEARAAAVTEIVRRLPRLTLAAAGEALDAFLSGEDP